MSQEHFTSPDSLDTVDVKGDNIEDGYIENQLKDQAKSYIETQISQGLQGEELHCLINDISSLLQQQDIERIQLDEEFKYLKNTVCGETNSQSENIKIELISQYSEKYNNIQSDILVFLNQAFSNTLTDDLSNFNINKFDQKDNIEGFSQYELEQYAQILDKAMQQMHVLGSFYEFSNKAKEIGEEPSFFSWKGDIALANKLDLQEHIFGKSDKHLTHNLHSYSEEELFKMKEESFDITDNQKMQNFIILLGLELGNGIEDILKFIGNIPAAIILLPRYITNRVTLSDLSIDSIDEVEAQMENDMLLKENPALMLCELLGEKGIQMIKKLGEMFVSGKNGDIASVLVMIAGLLAGGAGLAKIGSNLARKSAVKSARSAGRKNRTSQGREFRNNLKILSGTADNIYQGASKIDDIIGGAALGHLAGAYSKPVMSKAEQTQSEKVLARNQGLTQEQIEINSNLNDYERAEGLKRDFNLSQDQIDVVISAHHNMDGYIMQHSPEEWWNKLKAMGQEGKGYIDKVTAIKIMDYGYAGKMEGNFSMHNVKQKFDLQEGTRMNITLGDNGNVIIEKYNGKYYLYSEWINGGVDQISRNNAHEILPGSAFGLGRNIKGLDLGYPEVSGNHLSIEYKNGELSIHDHSTNGTLIKNYKERVPQSELHNMSDIYQLDSLVPMKIQLGSSNSEIFIVKYNNKYYITPDGKNNHQEIKIDQPLTIGRNNGSGLGLNFDNTVSGQHLTLEHTSNGIKVTDHSTNGTKIEHTHERELPGASNTTVQTLKGMNIGDKIIARTGTEYIIHSISNNIVEIKALNSDGTYSINQIDLNAIQYDPKFKELDNMNFQKLSQTERVQNRIITSNSINELLLIIQQEGSIGKYDFDYLKEVIQGYLKGELDINYITRTLGLRDKIALLKNQEFINNQPLLHKLWPKGLSNTTNQGRVGNCYFVAALNALKSHPSGGKMLEKMITEVNGGWEVKFPGSWKKYTITENDVFEMGDKKINTENIGDNILERAHARYINEKKGGLSGHTMIPGIQGKLNHEGGLSTEVFDLMFGNNISTSIVTNGFKSHIDRMMKGNGIIGIDSKFSKGKSDIHEYVTQSAFGEEIKLYYAHAYTITNTYPAIVNGKHIQIVDIVNPHDSSKILQFNINNLEQFFSRIMVGEFHKGDEAVESRNINVA